MKKNKLFALIFFSLSLLSLILFLSIDQEDNLYGSVIRIHVLANSDEEADQERKLLVRDRILSFAKENLTETASKKEAEEEIQKCLPRIISLAEDTLKESGSDDSVSATLSREYYPTRQYEDFSLPAGNYLSLRVMIGKAEGQNWWCVLFPPICINSALETEDALAKAGMNEKNISTVTRKKGYVYRFKILEIWQKSKKGFQELF